jgi:hypothetical protein
MKWFKFYGQDYLSDPKILALSGSERSCWITLLSYGSVNDNGMITFLDEEQLMAQSGISPMHEEWDATLGVLNKLKRLKMIDFDNDVITILNWKKRQETSLTGYERVKKCREKKRDDNANDNAKITSDKIRIDKNRKDINISSEQGSQENRVMEVFSRINPTLNWGNKTTRKAAAEMIKKFGLDGTLKMAEQITSVQGQKFAPVATTPYQMKEKLAQFKIYFESQKNRKGVFLDADA